MSVRATYLRQYNKRIDTSQLEKPDLEGVRGAILLPKNTSPGPDGIPFAAWRATVDLAAPILHAVMNSLCSGQPPPAGFNHALLFLLPKKKTDLVFDTRPLSVTNTDNRILAALMAKVIMPSVLELIDLAQKGLGNGRSGADHTVDINEFFYEGVEEKIDRYLFLLDTAKAFDSIDHKWITLMLAKTKFPQWFQSFVKAALSEVRVAPFFGKSVTEWIPIERGVKQGCPLSPLLFIIAYDPLLHRLRSLTNISSYAFADDLAITSDNFDSVTPALRALNDLKSPG